MEDPDWRRSVVSINTSEVTVLEMGDQMTGIRGRKEDGRNFLVSVPEPCLVFLGGGGDGCGDE